MAKTAKKEKVEKTETTAEFKYGVKDLAEELGIKETSVRVQLRNKGIEKAGKSYGWNSKAELKEVVAQLKSSTKNDDDEDEAPAKSKKAKAEKAKPGKADKKAKKAKTKKARDEEDEDEDDD